MVKLLVKDKSDFEKRIAMHGFSKKSLSIAVGVTNQYLYSILSGKRNPSPELAKRIAKKLDSNISDIFFN